MWSACGTPTYQETPREKRRLDRGAVIPLHMGAQARWRWCALGAGGQPIDYRRWSIPLGGNEVVIVQSGGRTIRTVSQVVTTWQGVQKPAVHKPGFWQVREIAQDSRKDVHNLIRASCVGEHHGDTWKLARRHTRTTHTYTHTTPLLFRGTTRARLCT